ncbi:hypothetical protein Dac01nite_05420 [Demequina activiva]|uniref:LPXTG cell wall anchor domain-containing protein n=1 Tax=Demequina activiva TaxID=1582364 RepID=A0A919Q004_9MICO|nr:hypothetical protein Dac01nite_05420 [Demequina activiva]
MIAAGAGQAMAAPPYPASDYSVTCSTQQVPVTNSFECEVRGPDGAQAQLQTTFAGEDADIVAGTVTSSAKEIAGGLAQFTVLAPSVEGPIDIVGIVDGEVVPGGEIVVLAVDTLATTGFDSWNLVIVAASLVVVGGAVVIIAVRRRESKNVEQHA